MPLERISIVGANITALDVDATANAANPFLPGGGTHDGVLAALGQTRD